MRAHLCCNRKHRFQKPFLSLHIYRLSNEAMVIYALLEICFVVFAGDEYIMGESRFIRIIGLRLEK